MTAHRALAAPRAGGRRGLRAIAGAALAGLIATMLSLVAPVAANAANIDEFDPGYLISDDLFYDGGAMSESQIQSFLNGKLGSCSNSNCLKSYKQTTSSRAATPRCAAYAGAASEPAARIIFKVQQACGISAKVLLVMLQKEQGLITNKGPSADKLKIAMGYGCPDTAACDSLYFGFMNQVYSAAAQFQRYRQSPGGFRHQVGVPMNLYYHPNSVYASPPKCGTLRVTIKNDATAGLYNYTPYTPNAAALANPYGTGDSCSSYGNRNFFVFYSDWFGSPAGKLPTSVAKSRLAGDDRYKTSAAVSASAYPDPSTVTTVFVASGENFPDGLSAAPAAAIAGAPLLLTKKGSLPGAIKNELLRLDPDRIIVVGGTPSVSKTVENQLREIAAVTRLAGDDRYATSRAIARYAFPDGAPEVFIAIGNNFPDALAASAAAGFREIPVILVPHKASSADSATRQLIAQLGATRVYVAGNTSAIKNSYLDSLKSGTQVTGFTRLGGSSRYQTAAAINTQFFTEPTAAYLVSGKKFPDALSVAAVAGVQGAALHLSPGNCLPGGAVAHMTLTGVEKLVFVGSSATLGSGAWGYKPC